MKKLFISSLFVLMGICPLSANAGELSAFGDFLVWHASEETASIWSSIITEPTANTTNFTPANVDFNWSHGFRGGLLYQPENNFLDTKLYWTYLPAKASVNYALASQVILPEFFSGFLSKDIFFGSNLDWHLMMNTLDFQVSHAFNPIQSLTLRPSIGIKGGTINQSIHAKWNALFYTATEKVKNDFSGIGPSFGIDAKWNIYNKLSLVSNFSTALMWGNWKISDIYSRPEAVSGLVTPTTIKTSMKDSQLGTLMLDYFLGVEWHHEGRSQVSLRLGYEMQYWANQLRLLTFQQLPLHGDLTLQGATCGIQIDL